jgi:hypothetical protein
MASLRLSLILVLLSLDFQHQSQLPFSLLPTHVEHQVAILSQFDHPLVGAGLLN